MNQKIDEGVVGAFLAIAFSATSIVVLSMIPAIANVPENHVAIVPAAIIFACLGVLIGVVGTRLARRRPSDTSAADYDDMPGILPTHSQDRTGTGRSNPDDNR